MSVGARDGRPREADRAVVGGPDPVRLRAWLRSPAVLDDAGAVFSWENPAHPGYAYPEAAGLWLSAHCAAGCAVPQEAHRVARWLASRLGPQGGVGRDGLDYAFDSAVALSGFLHYRAAGGWVVPDATLVGLHAFVAESLATRTPLRPAERMGEHWSLAFAPHLLKLALTLGRFERAFGTTRDAAVAAVLEDLAHDFARAPEGRAYLHAHCYAIEGLVALDAQGAGSWRARIDHALGRLASLQRADGGLPAFASGSDEARTDATAQAVRLWVLRDRERWSASIVRALEFLARCQSATGGLLYAPGRDDVNTWSSLFAAQALDWLEDGARPDELL